MRFTLRKILGCTALICTLGCDPSVFRARRGALDAEIAPDASAPEQSEPEAGRPEPEGGAGGTGGRPEPAPEAGAVAPSARPEAEAGREAKDKPAHAQAGKGGSEAGAGGATATASELLSPSRGPYAAYRDFAGHSAQTLSTTYRVLADESGNARSHAAWTRIGLVDSAGSTQTFADPARASMPSHAGALIGLQPNSALGSHQAAVFAILGPSRGDTAHGAPCENQVDGALGTSCQIADAYQDDTPITLRIEHRGGGMFQGFAGERLIGTITAQTSNGFGNELMQWVEPLSDATACESEPYFKASLDVPVLEPALRLTPALGHGAERCSNALVSARDNPASLSFELGTPRPNTMLSLRSKANTNWVTAASTDDVCGGALAAETMNYGRCARLSEVDRGASGVLLQTSSGARVRCTDRGDVLADARGTDALWTRALEADGFYTYRSGNKYLGVRGTELVCGATSAADSEKFLRTDTTALEQYTIRNVWNDTYLIDRDLGRVYNDNILPRDERAQWFSEMRGDKQRCLRNVQTGLYLNNQGAPVDADGHHVVACTSVEDSWSSALWTLEPIVSSRYRIRSVARPEEFVNVEQLLGYPEVSAVEPGWVSAHWHFELLLPLENKALWATAAGSSDSPGQEFAKARDGVIDGYRSATSGDYTKEWASDGGKPGAFIEYTWSSPQLIQDVAISDRVNNVDHITAGTLSFSDGSTIAVGDLPNDGTRLLVPVPALTVSSLRFTIVSISTETANPGLAELAVH